MKALLLKDRDWLSFFLAAGVAAMLVLVLNYSYSTVWVGPSFRFLDGSLLLLITASLVLGVFAAIRDELTRTEEYLIHRPVSLWQIFYTKTAACLVIVLVWITIPFAFQSVFPGLWDPNRPIADGWRFFEILGICSLAFFFFAGAYFAGTLPFHWFFRLFLGITIVLGIVSLVDAVTMAFGGGGAVSLLAYTAINLAGTLLLLFGSWQNFKTGKDRDRPLPLSTLRLSGTLTGLAFVTCAVSGIALLQQDIGYNLIETYPFVSFDDSGKPVLCCWHLDKSGYHTEQVDERYNPILDPETGKPVPGPDRQSGAPSGAGDYALHEWMKSLHPTGYLAFYKIEGEWERLTNSASYKVCYFHEHGGLAYLISFFDPQKPNQPFKKRIGRTEAQLPFSSRTEVINRSNQGSLALVGDLEDGTLWTLDLEKGEECFHRLPLPGNDRFCGYIPAPRKAGEITVEGKVYVPKKAKSGVIIHGERGSYLWDGSGLVEDTVDRVPTSSVVISYTDPIDSVLEVRDEKGVVCMTHCYGLYQPMQRFLGGALYFLSLFRAPLFQVAGFFQGEDAARITFVKNLILDPLLVSGRRAWLLLSNLGLACLLAVLGVNRLRRLGASRGRMLFWALALMAGGPTVWVLFIGFERGRAYLGEKEENALDAASLLIQSPV